jgi:DNA gyrase/topoisomerase IV, subunit A
MHITHLTCLLQDFLANDLQLQFEKLSNQARFVKMIVNKELVVSNRKKADIVEELRQKKFRPFPKAAKAKAAGETEDVEANDDDEAETTGTSTDYDYLLGMAIWSLTKEKVRIMHEDSNPSDTHTQPWFLDREAPSASGRQGEGVASPSRTHSNSDLEHRLGPLPRGMGCKCQRQETL